MTKKEKNLIFSDIQKIKESLNNLGTLACNNDFVNYGKCEKDISFLLNNLKEYITNCK